MNIEITKNPEEQDDDFVITKTREHNSQFIENDVIKLSAYVRTDEGVIVAGLVGKTYWKWLHIEYLWVSESLRGQQLGTQLVLGAEQEAINRGCVGSTLDTFSFQALGFYQKLGYSLVGTLSGYTGNHQRHYLGKNLVNK